MEAKSFLLRLENWILIKAMVRSREKPHQLTMLAAVCFGTAVFCAQPDPERAVLEGEISRRVTHFCITASLKKR